MAFFSAMILALLTGSLVVATLGPAAAADTPRRGGVLLAVIVRDALTRPAHRPEPGPRTDVKIEEHGAGGGQAAEVLIDPTPRVRYQYGKNLAKDTGPRSDCCPQARSVADTEARCSPARHEPCESAG